jgi:hypothetical protein
MSSLLKQQIGKWKKLLAANKLKDLFDDISNQLNPERAVFDQIILLKSRFLSTYGEVMGGRMPSQEADIEFNKIRQALLDLFSQLSAEDLGAGGSLEDPLDELITKLIIRHPLTPLQIVNCDRTEVQRSFFKSFRNWDKQHSRYQFYFALSCPIQEPDSFAERMVFEIMEARLKDHSDSINYPRRVDGERLLIPPLPLGIDLNDYQDNFRRYIAERFHLSPTTSFQDFLKYQLPDRKERYIAMPFDILAGDWDPDLMEEYLPWIMNSFSKAEAQGPTCIFIFIIKLKNAHRPEKIRYEREVKESIDDIIEKHREKIGFLYPFPEVPQHYVEEWFERIAVIRQDQTLEILELLKKQLSDTELALFETKDHLLNMERIKYLQERIWNIHRNKL